MLTNNNNQPARSSKKRSGSAENGMRTAWEWPRAQAHPGAFALWSRGPSVAAPLIGIPAARSQSMWACLQSDWVRGSKIGRSSPLNLSDLNWFEFVLACLSPAFSVGIATDQTQCQSPWQHLLKWPSTATAPSAAWASLECALARPPMSPRNGSSMSRPSLARWTRDSLYLRKGRYTATTRAWSIGAASPGPLRCTVSACTTSRARPSRQSQHRGLTLI